MSTLDASVIIASRDRPALLGDAVNAVLRGQDVPAELIVVDQSRRPHPALSGPSNHQNLKLCYVRSQSTGLSRGRNLGIAKASCDVLVFIDDDVIVSTTWLGVLVRAMRLAAPRAVVTGQVRPAQPEVRGGFAPSTKVEQRPITYAGRSNLGVLFPNNAALPRSAFDEVGVFDARLGAGSTYPSSEDNDLCFRLLEAGYRIHYEPDAVVYHRAWRSPSAYVPLRWRYGRGQGAYYAKHFRVHDPYMLSQFFADGRRHITRMSNLRRQPLQALGEVAFVGGMLSGAAQWLLTERVSETGILATARRRSHT